VLFEIFYGCVSLAAATQLQFLDGFLHLLSSTMFTASYTNSFFDVFLTMHHSIELFHLPTLMHNSLFINNMYVTLQSSTFFEHQHAHLQEDNRIITASGIVTLRTVQYSMPDESNDTRCCDNTICPPEDGHVDARNMSRIVM
jgi:hypothetical protein